METESLLYNIMWHSLEISITPTILKFEEHTHTNLVFLGGTTGTARASLDGHIAPTDLLYFPLCLGEGG